MSKHDKPDTTRPVNRVIFPIQSPGDLGKSLTLSALISALKHWDVPFAALDADAQHRSLSRRNAGFVTERDATASKNTWHAMIRDVPDVPVTLIDFPSQKTDFLLEAFSEFRVLAGFERVNRRATVLLFSSDEAKAKESASRAVKAFGECADYLLVENPAKFVNDEFKKTPLYRLLASKGTPTIRLPALTDVALTLWDKLERSERRSFSLDEVCHPDFDGLDWFTKGTLQNFRYEMISQFEDVAIPRILSDVSLFKARVDRGQTIAFPSTPSHLDGLGDALL